MLKNPMKRRSFFALAIACTVAALLFGKPGTASATPEITKSAPALTGTDSRGKKLSLADLHGSTVVLDRINHDCPYVRKQQHASSIARSREGR